MYCFYLEEKGFEAVVSAWLKSVNATKFQPMGALFLHAFVSVV